MNRCGGSCQLSASIEWSLCCVIAATLNIALCSSAPSQSCPHPDFGRELKEYIGQQKEYHFSVVYTQCLDITSNGKIVLVFPLTIYKSLDLPNQRDQIFDRDFEQWPGIPVMLDLDFSDCVDNIAKLQADKKGFFVSDVLSGGMGTEAELEKQMKKMMKRAILHYLPPTRIEELLRAKPDRDCPR